MFLFFSCAMKCFEKFTEAERKRIFEKFYSHFKTKNEQDMYLQSLISVTNVSKMGKNEISHIIMLQILKTIK